LHFLANHPKRTARREHGDDLGPIANCATSCHTDDSVVVDDVRPDRKGFRGDRVRSINVASAR